MALKIRLRQQGRKNRPFYRLVVADSRSPRDGKYVESLGWYNPVETREDLLISVDAERVQHWIDNGAEVSESVVCLLAKTAPAVVKLMRERKNAKKMKLGAKRRERRRKAAA